MADDFQTGQTKAGAGCDCCCPVSFTTACLTLDLPDDAPFDQALGTNAWSMAGYLPMGPGELGPNRLGPLPGALHLTGHYFNPSTGTVVCYRFVVLIGFRCDENNKLILRVLSPLTIPTVIARGHFSPQGLFFFDCCDYSQFVAVGWGTDSGPRDDDGSCYFWGTDGFQLAAGETGQSWSDHFTIGWCGPPCQNAYGGCSFAPGYGSEDFVESAPQDISPSMEFAVTLPSGWLEIPLGGGLFLGPLDLTFTLDLDPETCNGQPIDFNLPISELGPCWVHMNGTLFDTGICNCCNTALQCGSDHPLGGFGESGSGVTFTTEMIGPSGACGGCTGVGITALAACLNRTWLLPNDYYGYSSVRALTPCTIPYVFVCYGDTDTKLTCNNFRFESRAEFTVVFPPNGSTTSTVTLTLNLTVREYACSGDAVTVACEATAGYSAEIEIDQLSCSGPWSLDLDTTGGCVMSWPSTITVNRAEASAFQPYSPTCCNPTSTETYDCLSNVCTPHGGPGGDYPNIGACRADGCEGVAVSFHCTSEGCVDLRDGFGPYATQPLCEADCLSGGGDTRPSCCGGTITGPNQVIAIITSEGACVCVDTGPVLPWAAGDNAYEASFPVFCGAAGAEVTVLAKLYCVRTVGGGQWWFELRCVGDLLTIFPVTASGDGTYSGSGPAYATNCVLCNPGDTIAVLITPVGDPATQPGLCQGSGGGA